MIACPTLYCIPAEDRAALAALDPEVIAAAQAQAQTQTPPAVAAVIEEAPALSQDAQQPAAQPRRRRHIDRSQQWAAVGTRLVGDYLGERFEAEVIKAPRLKSGKALRLLTQPVRGTVCNSMSKAMDLATLAERQRRGVKGRTGLPASGWDFWRPVS